jgi:hypothetical protein
MGTLTLLAQRARDPYDQSSPPALRDAVVDRQIGPFISVCKGALAQ